MKKLLLSTAVAASLLSAPAMAENTYVSLGYTALDVDAEVFAGSIGTADLSALNLTVGYSIFPHIAVEGFASLGVSEDSFDRDLDSDFVASTGFEIEQTSAFGINVVGTLPLSESFDVYAKLGYANISFDDTDSDEASADGASFGLGLNYNYNDRHSVFIDYVSYADGEYDDFDIELEPSAINLGYKVNF